MRHRFVPSAFEPLEPRLLMSPSAQVDDPLPCPEPPPPPIDPPIPYPPVPPSGPIGPGSVLDTSQSGKSHPIIIAPVSPHSPATLPC